MVIINNSVNLFHSKIIKFPSGSALPRAISKAESVSCRCYRLINQQNINMHYGDLHSRMVVYQISSLERKRLIY